MNEPIKLHAGQIKLRHNFRIYQKERIEMTTPPSQTPGEMPERMYCGHTVGSKTGQWDLYAAHSNKSAVFKDVEYIRADLAESRGSSPEWLQAIGKMLLEDLLTINVTDNARPIHFLILKELYDEIRLAKKALSGEPKYERNGDDK